MNRLLKLRTLFITPIALFAVVCARLPASADEQPVRDMFEGKIVSIQDRHLTLSIADQKPDQEIVVPDDAMILLNGGEATLEDLAVGMLAKVKCKTEDKRFAKRIDAMMRY